MKKIIFKTIILTIGLIIISLLLIYILTLPNIWKVFDLTNTSSIGDTIGGITSPLLGIISVIFLYLTLNRQIDSFNDQKIKNESDIIFMLFNQLDNEYNQIYLYSTNKGERIRKFGHEALIDYCNSVFKFYSGNKKFSQYYIADSIILVIRSFELIKKRIHISPLNSEMKELFFKKMETFYLCKLKDPLYKLTDLFEREKSLLDEYTLEINEFYKSMEKKL
ncbi:hypothetical protein [Polaribacter dokdonensis]|uniref:Phage abortive infection protein n=1 Tax=Polaribacter dokdonensis DSW-5 TaxID=1300348 RepID=A0A0N0CFW7_9FLAO|nr:hypothetical protein [Polaribacter dokdonensis]KOY52420.1 hypothetical protein I602_1980 [Polaribacter dokdonensis DSW-5]SEE45165.1 hypothetical protein SAMN05444353_1751 [Polaribacter dokdonensis DSW-5]